MGSFTPPAPETAPSKHKKRILQIAGVLVLVAAAAVGTVLLLTGSPQRIEAFGYAFEYPDDWEQTDTVREDKQVAIRPSDAVDGPDHVSVQRFDLSYDFEDERERFIAELHSGLDESDRDISKFTEDSTFAGRKAITYIETGEGTATVWLVIAQNKVQISIGCQWAGEGRARVEPACEEVVRSLEITG